MTGLTVLTGGSSFHFAVDAFSVSASCVTGKVAPARVGCTDSCVKNGAVLLARPPLSNSTGSTSPTGVPAQPPSANARRPPSISSPPPRLLTKSASIRSWSGENDAASTLPRMIAR